MDTCIVHDFAITEKENEGKNVAWPLIDVIIPIYKTEKYLRRCLDSVANQTYRNLRIILVDDGSPDQCPQICDEYAAKDPRFHVIHQENAGVSSARNAGLNLVQKCGGGAM